MYEIIANENSSGNIWIRLHMKKSQEFTASTNQSMPKTL